MAENREHSFTDPNQVEKYVQFRPQPPDELISAVVEFLKEKMKSPLELCLDVGCGSGQNTEKLSCYFKQVLGLDVSATQLEAARNKCQHGNVVYKESKAEKLPVQDGSVDLITCCVAVHWFDIEEFYAEVKRVLKPGGVLACYAHNFPSLTTKNNIRYYSLDWLKNFKYMAKELEAMYAEYATLPALYAEEVFVRSSEGKFFIEKDVNLEYILGMVKSFSSLKVMEKYEGQEAAQKFISGIKEKLFEDVGVPDLNALVTMRYDYYLRMWRKPSP